MNNSDKILAYLENTLSQSERMKVEGEIKKDPNLKTELDFQSEIIQGIQQARKNELKALLNNVPVGGGGFTSNLTGTHYITAALVTVLAGFGIFYLWPESVDNTVEIPSVIEESQPELLESEIEQVPVNEPSASLKETEINVQNKNTEISEKEILKKSKSEVATDEVLSAEENLALVKPQALDAFDATNEVEEIELPENALLEKSDFETTFIVSRENKFKEFDFH
ncbi:MAG: hypothetical protein OEY51_03445, partial [Cyclobacteriaceae bacterium]|nr:hypothetical protein [Cyclobacteriaceae bacterium]